MVNVFTPKSKSGGLTFQASGADKDAIARTMGVDPEAEPDTYIFLCKALDAPLPHPWTEHADKKGRVFYWNPASRHSSWQHPLTPSHKSLVAAYRRIMQEEDRQTAIQSELEAFKEQVEEEVGRWRQSYAPDGTPYFYKIGTQNTRWDNPRDELMAHMELRVKMLDELARHHAQQFAEPAEGDDLERTVDVGAIADASGITDATSPPAALADMGPPVALYDATQAPIADATRPLAISPASPSQQAAKSRPPMLALPEDADAAGSGKEDGSQKGTLRSFLGRVGGRKGRKGAPSSSASDASDAESGASTPKSNTSSVRSFTNFLTSGFKRNRSNERKNKDGKKGGSVGGIFDRISPKKRQREELAGLKVTRAAKHYLQWKRAQKYEAALSVQKAWRGHRGRQAFRREVERALAELRATEALPPELEALEKSLLEVMSSPLGQHRNRIQFERSKILAMQEDIDLSQYILPDEIALHHGLNFDLPIEKAVFNIVRPLLLRPLPVPWQILQRDHGRIDYFHAGVKEERRLHPLHTFFGEVITFLKAHVHTNIIMTEPMTAQIFREASPQFVRQRLGVWEGPHKDSSHVGGVRFKRLVPGEDKDCAEGKERVDDPRLEAAASVSARLEAWLHLWLGFAPEEPFPFLEGRLHALATQVSENVVVAPGAASQALVEQLKGATPLAVLAIPAHPILDPKEPEVLPLSKEEDALQPIVTCTLGKAYGSALAFVAKREAGQLEAEQPPNPELVEEEESEAEHSAVGEEEEYEDSFAEEEEEYGEDEFTEEESEEDISTATTAAQTPQSGRRPMQDIDALHKELAEEEKEEELPKEVQSFLPGYGEQAASDWATRMLRPLTPPQDRKEESKPWFVPGSPGKRPWHLKEPRAGQIHLWGENTLLADSQLRLELKEPPLEDWGQPPETAAKASRESPGSPVSVKVPLSPKDKARAAKALPHLAEPMKKEDLLKLRQEQQEKVDTFTKSLLAATDNFEHLIEEAETPPDSPSGRWRCGPKNAEETGGFRTGRPELPRPNLPANLSSAFGGEEDYVCPINGCVARANSPTKGSLPTPPHLEGATRASKKNGMKAWPVTRSSSADPAVERTKPETRYERPRPRSARARFRKPYAGLLPPKPSRAAEVAAQSCRRFLSRTCGTMQLALATFDSTGDGKFNRFEWEAGLKKLGYEANFDVQEIFTVLDKRRHHVLTLSDLLDHYNGTPITEGLPDPGLRGIASEIIHEALVESIEPVITQALADLLGKELLAPRGLPYSLPHVKGTLKKDHSASKKLARNPNQNLNVSGDERGSDFYRSQRSTRKTQFNMDQQTSLNSTSKSAGSGSPKSVAATGSKSPPGRKHQKNMTKLKMVGQLMRKKVRKCDNDGGSSGAGVSPSSKLERKDSDGSAKNAKITGQLNSTLSGPLGGSEMSLSGSPFAAISNRKKGILNSTGMSSVDPASSSSGMKKPGRGSRRNSSASRSPHPGGSPQRRASSPKTGKQAQEGRRASGASGASQAKSAGQRRPSSQPQQPQRRAGGVKPENKYAGFRFVKDDDSELADWEREKRLPWMPRPTEDICRTYGHIFRLLNDPKTKQISNQKPQKRSVHVSVPRMPTVPPGRGSFGLSDSGAFDSEEDAADGLGPLQNMKGSDKKTWGAKSSPDLHSSGLSTTVGTARPSSAGSQGSEDDPDRMRVSLPKLMKGGSPIDAGMRRRVPV